MASALVWGFVGAASLLIGALIALRRPPSQRVVGLIMGFGAGVLISALSFELVGKAAIIEGGLGGITLGLYAGCAVFAIGDRLLEGWAGPGVDDPATEEACSGLSLASSAWSSEAGRSRLTPRHSGCRGAPGGGSRGLSRRR